MKNIIPEEDIKIRSRKLYNSVVKHKVYIIILSFIVLCMLFIIDIITGPAWLSIKEVFTTLLFPASSDHMTYVIVWIIRLPIAVTAILVGASLGVAGAEMQTILNNPLASPFTLGISNAASFGAAVAIVLGKGMVPINGNVLIPVNAFLFALLSSLMIYFIARVLNGSTETIVLAGIAISFLFNALLSIQQYLATDDALKGIVHWQFGNLTGSKWLSTGIIFGVFCVSIPILVLDSWKLSSLRLGDNKAKSLGINVDRLRLKVLVIVSIITAVAVCFVGTIGFIGLVAPHISRSFVGEDQRYFMPFSALIGAVMLSFASVISKVVLPGAIVPVGIITSLIGIPFLLAIIFKRRGMVQ